MFINVIIAYYLCFVKFQPQNARYFYSGIKKKPEPW